LSLAGVSLPGLGWERVVASPRRPEPRKSGPLPRLGTWTSTMSTASEKAADDDPGADALLVERSRTGDTEAFARLVDRYQQRVFWVARGMLGNDEDARDAAQEAFIRVFRSLDRFDLRLKFYTWLYQIVVNLCIDMLRKQVKRRGVSLEQVGDVAGAGNGSNSGLESSELRQRVYRVLDELPPKYRTVMVLSDLEGIGAKDIAHMTGTTHATVRWRHHRARQLFREAWERIHGKGSHVL
jgi:RNA polymerase sigma-70 factor (ECF subfamily)